MAMGHRTRLKDGDEVDAFTRWRRVYSWKPGRLAAIKRKHNKRVRKQAKSACSLVEQ